MAKSFLLLSVLALGSLTKAYVVTGPTGGVNLETGERPFRQDFRKFQDTGAAFDLYVQALERFKADDQSKLLSYYEVAGIHGRPFRSWDGAEGPYEAGYCTHGSIIFPTWHRPYLSLFEQIIWDHAQEIALDYPEDQRQRYQAAAETLRIPYWDWATEVTVPPLLNAPNISITTPAGLQTIANPLYSYTFHPIPDATDFPPNGLGANFPSTVRYPDRQGKTQPDVVDQQLLANGPALHDRTCNILSQQPNYSPFSNHAFSSVEGPAFDSLEGIHDDVHVLVGRGAHMGSVEYAGFDPIFWLHHTNVDRLFAIWQAIHPDSYVEPQVDGSGTFTNPPGGIEDINTPLTPFHSDSGNNFYTSASARSTKQFGYSYPEVVDWGVSAEQLNATTKAKVNALYCSVSAPSNRTIQRRVPPLPLPETNGTHREWFINVRADKNELNHPYLLHYYLSAPPPDVASWSYAPQLVGTHTVFTPRNTTDQPPAVVRGQVPLTRRLAQAVAAGELASLESSDVEPYLKKNLEWRIQSSDDAAVPTKDLTTLRTYVVSAKVRPVQGEAEFPRVGEWEVHADVTAGKEGGWNEADGKGY
ncbi:MAG: hypothetical protein M1832_005407 [Thelocarpon impressellum]|nr:MAG: hypothetical protein M1832_005407 [Thelocarpon impressellum]